MTLPSCALECYITALTTSSVCPVESDLRCHCSATRGDILGAVGSCSATTCSQSGRKAAAEVIRSICASVDVDTGAGTGDGEGPESPTTIGQQSTGKSSTPSAEVSTLPAVLSSTLYSSSTIAASTLSTISTIATVKSTSEPTSTPTSTPLTPLPSHAWLSTAAKISISLSITLLFCIIIFAMVLYIRRLKKDLRSARATAGTTTQISSLGGGYDPRTGFAAASQQQYRQHRSPRNGRSSSAPLSPVSPLSPPFSSAFSSQKKNRNTALSLIVERLDEDDRSSMGLRSGRLSGRMSGRMEVREPVPGQREGLSEPLELDNTGIAEMPLSITPRTRSRERGRSFGEDDGVPFAI